MRAILTPLSLRLYDLYVLGFSSRFLWRCPASVLQELYDRNISDRHLDIGVGTGYFLDRARFPRKPRSISLVDINEHCLSMASRRIARHQPRPIVADILDPLPDIGPVDSVGLCYVLHCLPGDIDAKAKVFDNLVKILSPTAVVFGATIVQGDAPRSKAAQALMDFYNARNIFWNAEDRVEDLQDALAARFNKNIVRLQGCVAVFEAREPMRERVS